MVLPAVHLSAARGRSVQKRRLHDALAHDKKMVPRVGLEPTLLSEMDFESIAATDYATEANNEKYRAGYRAVSARPSLIFANLCTQLCARKMHISLIKQALALGAK